MTIEQIQLLHELSKKLKNQHQSLPNHSSNLEYEERIRRLEDAVSGLLQKIEEMQKQIDNYLPF